MTIAQQFNRRIHNFLLLCGVAFALTACAGSDTIDLTKNKNIDDAIEAATGPLQDLNLRRQEIPTLLVTAAANPYASIKKSTCKDVTSELAALDELLGPDMKPKTMALAASNGGLIEHISALGNTELPDTESMTMSLAESAQNLAHDTVMSTISSRTNILPFRSIIRKVSGADSHAKKLANAYQAGKLRRAYLKGVAEIRFGDKCIIKPVIVQAKNDSFF